MAAGFFGPRILALAGMLFSLVHSPGDWLSGIFAMTSILSGICFLTGLIMVLIGALQKTRRQPSVGTTPGSVALAEEGRWCGRVSTCMVALQALAVGSITVLLVVLRLIHFRPPPFINDSANLFPTAWLACGIAGLLYGIRAIYLAKRTGDDSGS